MWLQRCELGDGVESGSFPRKWKGSLSEGSAVTFLTWRPVSCCFLGQGRRGWAGGHVWEGCLPTLAVGHAPWSMGHPEPMPTEPTASPQGLAGGARGAGGGIWTHCVVASHELRVPQEERR